MRERRELELVRVAGWEAFPWLRHGFSTRVGGGTRVYGGDRELNLGLTPEDEAHVVERNRTIAAEAVGGPKAVLATVRQVHGKEVMVAERGGRAGDADGLVTAVPGVVLGILVADCVPVLVADVRRRLVGALHAGWRGTASGMVGAGVGRLMELGARVEDMVAAVGPSIGPCCYEVGAEVRERFPAGVYRTTALDLWESNQKQLVEAGIRADRVSVIGECTACARLGDGGRKYFSHRAEGGVTGRAMGMIAIVAE